MTLVALNRLWKANLITSLQLAQQKERKEEGFVSSGAFLYESDEVGRLKAKPIPHTRKTA
jgi:hypothetical protein